MTADPRAEAEKIIRDALERWVDTSASYYAAGFYSTDADNATDAILDALTAAGWSLLPPGGPQDLYVVIKSVPGREPEIMADIATDPGELNGWLAALRYNPADRLATYTGYRLAPADTPGEPA